MFIVPKMYRGGFIIYNLDVDAGIGEGVSFGLIIEGGGVLKPKFETKIWGME